MCKHFYEFILSLSKRFVKRFFKKNENFVKKFSCNKIIFTSVFFWKKYVVGF